MAETLIQDAVCLGCGCVCDDLSEIEPECSKGAAYLASQRSLDENDAPTARINGESGSLSTAIASAAEMLLKARRPLVWGLTSATLEAQRLAILIADRVGALVELGHAPTAGPKLRAFQRVGHVGATFGEIRDRADVVVFWRLDPVRELPRFFDRLKLGAPPRLGIRPGSPRTIVEIRAPETPPGDWATMSVELPPERDVEAFSLLRGWNRGARLDSNRVGSSFDALRTLFERFQPPCLGAIVFGGELGTRDDREIAWESASRFVRDLSGESRRIVSAHLGGRENAAGAEAVLGRLAGRGLTADYSSGEPREPLPGTSAETGLLRGEIDAVLVVGDDPARSFSSAAAERLSTLPRAVIAPWTTGLGGALVEISSASLGYGTDGRVLRPDGVCLPLRARATSNKPSAEHCLSLLLDRINAMGDPA